MATSLQQQLAAIAANSTHQLDLKAQKARHSRSLLFEPRDAAAQNFDTLFQICSDGFAELCQLDSRFLQFAKSLFSEQSKSEDRTHMTTRENQDLDTVIDRFLALLSGRLLLKPALKAAEWLVRRFQAHEYNSEALLHTFLPYHTAPIFPVLLSILPAELPANFKFLHPYVASRQCPPRHAIVAAAGSNPAFFTAFNRRVIDIANYRYQSAIVTGFWASVTAQAVNGMIDATRSGREAIRQQREEDLLLRVLPVLQSALKVKGAPELYLGACMVLTILATRMSPEEKLLDAMLEAIAGAWSEQTHEDGFTCLAVVAEEKHTLALPSSVVRAALQVKQSAKIIRKVASFCRADKLVVGLCTGSIEVLRRGHNERAYELLTEILPTKLLSESQSQIVARRVQEVLNQAHSLAGIDKQPSRDALLSIAQSISETTTPDSQDVQVEEIEMITVDDAQESAAPPFDLTALPALPSKSWSFLDPAGDVYRAQYLVAFHHCSSTASELTSFLSLDALQRTDSTSAPNFFSFLAYAWSSDGLAACRLKALQVANNKLEECVKSAKSAVDLQALIPYALAALSDTHRGIRSAAALLCSTLGQALQLGHAASRLVVSTSWARESVYGKASSLVTPLAAEDLHKFYLLVLQPLLNACLLDNGYITRGLSDVFDGPHESRSTKTGLSTTQRTHLATFFAGHARASPVFTVKTKLLEVLKHAGKVAQTSRVQIILPYATELLDRSSPSAESAQRTLLLKGLLDNITTRSSEEIQFLKSLVLDPGAENAVQDIALQRLRLIWSSMKDSAQIDFADSLIAISLGKEYSDDVQASALDTLRSLPLSSEVLIHITESLPAASEVQDQPSSAKKSRAGRMSDVTRTIGVDKEKLASAVRRLTIVLDIVEGSAPEKHPQLLRGLFYLLSELHHYKAMTGSELAYLQGSLINSLLAIVDGLRRVPNKSIDKSVVRADLIVECVRTTSNTQVHHAALLLMSSLASWAPDLVLHSVMPLFTFMSSTILKQSDDYSAHVTEKTVAQIIPPLAASLKKSGRNLISGAADLLLSFTAAYEHIPIHRRSGLFRHLVQTLGPNESLFAIMAMLTDRYSDEPSVPLFVANLMSEFTNTVQLAAVSQYLDLVFDTLKVKRGLSDQILTFAEKSKEEAKTATRALLVGLADIVAQDSLPRSLEAELLSDGEEAEQIRVRYADLLEKAMQMALQVKGDDVLRPSADRLLSALLSLMPTKDFIDASARLMQGGSDEIRQQVFRSLEQRASTAKRGDKAIQSIFIDVLPNCTWFISNDTSRETRHAAIACVDQIAERFGKTDRDAVMDAAQQVASDSALYSDDVELRIMSTLCIASMVEVLEMDFLPLAPKALDQILAYLEDLTESEEPSPAFFKAVFAFLENILDHVNIVLSGKRLDRILALSAASLEIGDEASAIVQQFCVRVAKKLSPAYVLSSLKASWPAALGGGPDAVRLYVDMLQQLVKRHTKAVVTEHIDSIYSLMQLAFDARSRLHVEVEDVDMDEEESDTALASLFQLVDETSINIVLKLNDATFRPLFNRLADWATDADSPDADRQTIILRSTSLYSFTLALFEHLKSLVTSYASTLIESASDMLPSLQASQTSEVHLIDLITQTLASSFRHDQDGFWQSPAHFDAIAGTLLGQLERASQRAPEEFLIPAITELATAAGSSDHYRTMNSALMTFMRHEDSDVRLAAVKCERAITEKLNIDWLAMLPEMLPVINELQEDDDEVVERETLRWMKQMEDVTGQSIQDMLR